MLEKFKNLRKSLKNPKTKSLTLICIYTLFFIFAAVFIRLNDSVKPNVVQKKEPKISNYEFSIELTDNEEVTKILGNYNNNSITFNILDTGYYYQNGKYYLDGEEVEDYNLFNPIYYTYSNIELLKKNSTFVEETTYSGGNKKATYNISIKKYFEILGITFETDIENIDEINALIVIEYLDNINNVNIDLSSYYNYTYVINIKYENIKKQ